MDCQPLDQGCNRPKQVADHVKQRGTRIEVGFAAGQQRCHDDVEQEAEQCHYDDRLPVDRPGFDQAADGVSHDDADDGRHEQGVDTAGNPHRAGE